VRDAGRGGANPARYLVLGAILALFCVMPARADAWYSGTEIVRSRTVNVALIRFVAYWIVALQLPPPEVH
jgi:hypothetical protein